MSETENEGSVCDRDCNLHANVECYYLSCLQSAGHPIHGTSTARSHLRPHRQPGLRQRQSQLCQAVAAVQHLGKKQHTKLITLFSRNSSLLSFPSQDNVRRFKRIQYPYQKREDVLRCFGNFDDALSENDLWELSEKIRPRQRASPAKLANDE